MLALILRGNCAFTANWPTIIQAFSNAGIFVGQMKTHLHPL